LASSFADELTGFFLGFDSATLRLLEYDNASILSYRKMLSVFPAKVQTKRRNPANGWTRYRTPQKPMQAAAQIAVAAEEWAGLVREGGKGRRWGRGKGEVGTENPGTIPMFPCSLYGWHHLWGQARKQLAETPE
jgi:hypothetical protein